MRRLPVLVCLAILAAATASAQSITQDFETGLKYEECWAGDNVGLNDTDVPLQGQWRLQTGPLNSNKGALYLTPWLSLTANGAIRFIHRNESFGGQSHPTVLVDLLNPDGSLFGTIYSYTHTDRNTRVTGQAVVPQDGVYRVQFRFVSDSGNERAGLDDIRIDGATASTEPPTCGPILPGVIAPTAIDDAGLSHAGAAVLVPAIANDVPGTNPINPETIDLQPTVPGLSATLDLRAADGTLIGRAGADASGNVLVEPVPGYAGALVVPYSIRDTAGAVSNIALIVVSVRGVTLDLRVEAAGPSTAAVGEPVRYLTRVTNNGPGDAAQATLTLAANAALGSLVASCPALQRAALSCGPPAVAGNTITILLSSLPAGTSTIVQLDAVVLGGQGPTATVTGTAAAAAPDVDSVPADNSATVATAITGSPSGADVAVTISGTDILTPGQTATYSTTVTNHGPAAADGVQLVLTAPPGFTFDGNSGDCLGPFPCALGTLASGASRTITTRYRTIVPPGVITIQPPVSIQAQATAVTADPVPSNNTASTTTAINATLDVAVAITPASASAPIGLAAEVFVLAENAGPNPARGFTVQLVLPPGLTATSATPSVGSIGPTGLWSIPEILPERHAELRLQLSPGAAGVFHISAAMTPPPTDANANNDHAEGIVEGQPSADLATQLTTSTPAPPVGTHASVTARAGNFGPSAATDARVILTLPAGLRLVSAVPPVGGFDPVTLTWSLGSLAPGAVFAMPVVVAVDAPGQPAMSARVLDADLAFDPDLVNNTHTLAFNAASSADLGVTIAADIPSPVVGQLVAIKSVILNGGPSPAPASVVQFTAPAGALTVVSVAVSSGTVGGGQWTLGTLAPGARATLDAVIRIDTAAAIPITATAATSAADPNAANNVASVTLNGSADHGDVSNDFEDLTGSGSCWIQEGMAPGGLTPEGLPFGRFQANPPLQMLVQLVSGQLNDGADTLVSPWIQLYGTGAIRFATKVTDLTSTPRLRVYLEDVATRTPTLVLDHFYGTPRLNGLGDYLTIPITATGIYRVRWLFTGDGGGSRAAIDDIVIDGTQASEAGAPGEPVPTYDCRPIIPGNLPPVAAPDFATTPVDAPVSVALLANDHDPDGSLNPQFVDLDPSGTPGDTIVRNIFRSDGVKIGRAVYLASGPALQFTPEPGITGTAEVPYTVQDNVGGVSNVSFVTILVGSVSADLSVTITAPSSATVGQGVIYAVRIENTGPDGAVDVPLQFAFNGMTVQSATCAVKAGGAVCGAATVAGSTVSAIVPGLPRESVVEYSMSATTPPSAATVSGTATVAAVPPVTDPSPANNSATAVTIVDGGTPPVRADLVVTKSGPAEAAIGQRATYIVDVVNRGPDSAAAVAVSDPTPPGFMLVGISGACSSTPCALGTMPVGQSRRVVYEYVVGPATRSIGGGVPTVNVASVSSTTPDPLPGSNISRFVTRVFYATDLEMTAATRKDLVAVGQQARLTFTVSNDGPGAAYAVAAEILLPAGLTFAGATPAGAFNPATGVWTIGTVAAGDAVELTITADATAPGTLATTGRLIAGTLADTDAANDEATATITAIAVADVRLASAADDPSPLAGDLVTLTLTAGNAGPSPATGLLITGVLPAGLTYQSHTLTQGSLDLATSVWNAGTLAPGAGATLTLMVRVDRAGVFNTSAAVTAMNEVDFVQGDNSTGVLLNAGAAADAGIEISSTVSDAIVGQVFALQVVVKNAGPSAAADVAAFITIPPGLRVTGIAAGAGSVVDGRWQIGPLAPGGAATLDVNVEALATGPQTVSGAVTHAEPDPNPVNDSAFVSVNTSGSAELRLSMIAGTPDPLISGNATVYVVISNEGDSTSLPVEVNVSQDAGLTPMSAQPSQGAFDLATGRWSAGPLPPGGLATLALVLRVSAGGSLPVSAAITAPSLTPAILRSASAVVTLEVYDPLRTVADLQLTMSATPRVAPGELVTIEALAFNAGSTYALDLTTVVGLPAGAMFVSATPSFRGVCTTPAAGASGTVTCTWPGQSVVGYGRLRLVTIVAQAAAGLPEGARLGFGGAVSSLTFDPFPLNNTASVATAVSASATTADVAIAKSFDDGATIRSIPAGRSARYRVVATNHGPAGAVSVAVHEGLPPGFIVTSATASHGSVDAAGVWSIGAMSPGAAATLEVALVAGLPGRFELVSTRMLGSPDDANPANDRASIVADVVPANGGGRFVATGNVDGIGAAEIITGSGMFEAAQVRLFGGDGSARSTFYPFDPRFQGGVRVAACDVDADGRDEIVAAAGPGGGPHIRILKVFAPDRIVEVNSWYAFDEVNNGGVWVACGDVTGDGAPDVVAGSGTIGAPLVRVWEIGLYSVRERFTLPVFSAPRPEARVAICDVDGDGRGEILAASGPGGPAEVMVLDPVAGAVRASGPVLAGLATGALVACGDLTPLSPGPEVIVSADAGGPPLVEFYSASGVPLAAVLMDAPAARGGVRAAVGDVDPGAPGRELVLGAGVGAVPVIRVVSAFTGVLVELRQFVAPNVP